MNVPFVRDRKSGPVYFVLESDGVTGGLYPVQLVKGYNEGLVLVYQRGDKVERVYKGRKYIPLRVNGGFWVGKRVGNDSAAALVEIDGEGDVVTATDVVGLSTDPNTPGEDLSNLVRADILGIGMKAVQKKSYLVWIIMAVAVVIVVAIVAFASKGG